MTSKTIQNLQYFMGKVCSIISTSMNRSFDESISREHFVVRVQSVTQDGIWGTHPYNEDLLSFFAIQHIISIHQEIELDPLNPEHEEIIKNYENKTGKKLEGDLKNKENEKTNKNKELPIIQEPTIASNESLEQEGDATFVDIRNLEMLAEKSRRTFQADELLNKTF